MACSFRHVLLHTLLHSRKRSRYSYDVTTNPFKDQPPSEVPLRDAPLVRVISQLRFPPVLSIEKRDFVAPFQEEIRPDYPNLRPEKTRGVVLGPQGVVPGPKQVVWRFSDASGQWRGLPGA